MNLNQMRNLSKDWNLDGALAPNDLAINNTSIVIEAIGFNVFSMLPSVEEGIMIHYKNGDFGVFIECYNDGEIGYTLTHNDTPISSKDLNFDGMSGLVFIQDIRNHLNLNAGLAVG